VGEIGPLIPRFDQSAGILVLHIADLRSCPKGLNIDGLMIFDMQIDGGVDGIEILQSLGASLATATKPPRPSEKYWRLFLEPIDQRRVEQDSELVLERDEHFATLRVAPGEADSRYLVGPGVVALVGSNMLLGLVIDLRGFVR
jgi:hypothetical protein